MTYIVEEPTKKTVYVDKNGGIHDDRDAALTSNFKIDLDEALSLLQTKMNYHVDPVKIIEHFIISNPEKVRILLGDKNLTSF